MDIRYVMGNGIEAWGQEMGHGFGIDHSRVEGSDVDYQDPWDVMSTANAYSDVDPNYGHRGPGLNAWNMRNRKWLDESRIWRHGAATPFSKNVVIRPLYRRDLSGYLGLELPGASVDGKPFLVEFRARTNWDSGIPESCVLVHRFEGPTGQFLGTHSYLILGPRTLVEVVDIDDVDQQAEIMVLYSASLSRCRLRSIPKWEWSPEQILQNAQRFSTDELQRIALQAREVSRAVAQILKDRAESGESLEGPRPQFRLALSHLASSVESLVRAVRDPVRGTLGLFDHRDNREVSADARGQKMESGEGCPNIEG